MPIDLTDAVETAVYTSLAARVALPAKVFAVVPETLQPPLVVIAGSSVAIEGSKTQDFERHEVRIVSLVAGTSKRALFALMHQVREALHRQPIVFAGAELSDPLLLSSDDRLDEDGATMIGEQAFLIFAQPA